MHTLSTLIPCRPAAFPLLLLLCGLGACGGGQTEGEVRDHMELYCQTTRCICVEDSLVPFGRANKQEPEWRLSGEPDCSAGFHLETAGD